jgi:hypothetical protein
MLYRSIAPTAMGAGPGATLSASVGTCGSALLALQAGQTADILHSDKPPFAVAHHARAKEHETWYRLGGLADASLQH